MRRPAAVASGGWLLAAAVLVALAAGGLLFVLGQTAAANAVWAGTVAVVLVPLTWSVARTLAKRRLGVDLIALLAMAGSLALGEYLAGAVVALMLAGGNALEAAASGRAARELTALVQRAPQIAHLRRDGAIEEVPVDAVRPGDVVMVRAGEVVPVDGRVASVEAIIDTSALTGEPLPRREPRGSEVRSGTANAGSAFDLRASRVAAESAYANLVRLVQEAEAHRAPLLRMADRYAALFLPATLAVAALAWSLSGDPVRALAVLVVATPCPLILAAPVALIAGVSRAARRGVIVKGGAVIESLGGARTVLLDKTGTLTAAAPEIASVIPIDGVSPTEVLRLAASLEQSSAHVVAEALVHDERVRGLRLTAPEGVVEAAGQGIEGRVGERLVAVGSRRFLRERGYQDGRAPSADDGVTEVLVGVDGRMAGAILLEERLRDEAAGLGEGLHAAGVTSVIMVTGDRRAAAERIGLAVGVDRVHSDCTPEDKLALVQRTMESAADRPVVMVGDGINDAPALALADVGIAMAGEGRTVSSDAAGAVIVGDRVDRVVEVLGIGRRSVHIARQSIVFGMGLSLIAMVFAAFGLIVPAAGALLQEGIDVAVILNALRAHHG